MASKYRSVDEWTCMNYGFLAEAYEGNPPLEHTSKMLYEHVMEGIDSKGKKLVEIGCGRGGGLKHLNDHWQPSETIGVDLSEWNITFCNHRFSESNLSYEVGSAMEIPLTNDSCDCLINIESSHIYPDFNLFCIEAARVLKPGGLFSFADFREAAAVDAAVSAIEAAGFEIDSRKDISANVCFGLTADADNRRALIAKYIPFWLRSPVSQFAGVPGSKFYNDLSSGETIYVSVKARKR